MSQPTSIGALVIGQSPRPDLVRLLDALSDRFDIREAGALDTMSADTVPSTKGGYPLNTTLRDGAQVVVSEAALEAPLQAALDRLEADAHHVASVLLCAGEFSGLSGSKALFKPFAVAAAALKALGITSIGVLCPYPDQEEGCRQKWTGAGFEVTVWVAPFETAIAAWLPEQVAAASGIGAVVLDYVSYPAELVSELQDRLHLPVIDPGLLAAFLAEAVSPAGSPA